MDRTLRLVLLIVWFGCSLYAEDPTCTARTVPVGILDSRGDVPQDLPVASFVAKLDKKPLEITNARLQSGPKRVVVLVDTSGSMRKDVYASGKANLAYWAVADTIKRLPKDVSLAVVGFSDRVERPNFSLSREQLELEITQRTKSAETSSHGRTALREAVKYILDRTPNVSPGDAIYVVTDGADNSSRIGVLPLESELVAARVRLSVFLLQDFSWTGTPLPWSDEVRQLAIGTGGMVIEIDPAIHGTGTTGTTENFNLPSKQQSVVSDELTLLYRQTASPYFLDLKLPTALKKPHKWKLEIADEQRRKSTYMFYPSEIWPCEVEAKTH